VSWQGFFGTSARSHVEELCRKHSMDCEWVGSDGLRIRQPRTVITEHPETKEPLFFGQLQLHHLSCLDAEVRASLRGVFEEADLPRNVYYGDGSPIEDEVMARLGEAYEKHAVAVGWQTRDILMLDNMLTAHARRPYRGPRKILVALGDLMTSSDKE
jgi:hypothetical protein